VNLKRAIPAKAGISEGPPGRSGAFSLLFDCVISQLLNLPLSRNSGEGGGEEPCDETGVRSRQRGGSRLDTPGAIPACAGMTGNGAGAHERGGTHERPVRRSFSEGGSVSRVSLLHLRVLLPPLHLERGSGGEVSFGFRPR
jgi:hypothetical protein